MSPRPRKASDDEIFAAAARAMHRLSPAELTLQEIAAEAGLTAGALVQRFGSKRALMLAVFEHHARETPRALATLRASRSTPLEAVRTWAQSVAQMGSTPAALAHGLSYLMLDFADPEFHGHARAQAVATREFLTGAILDAVAAGELVGDASPAALARLVEATVTGSLIVWGFHQEGPAGPYIERDLEAALRPYLASGGL